MMKDDFEKLLEIVMRMNERLKLVEELLADHLHRELTTDPCEQCPKEKENDNA